MTEKIEPALTPEEWADVAAEEDLLFLDRDDQEERPPVHGRFWNGMLAGFLDADLNMVPVLPQISAKGRYTDKCDPVPCATRRIRDRDRQRLAALCLHGQQFGFTWEDIDAIKLAAEDLATDEYAELTVRHVATLRSLAARIAALLPPR